MTDITEKIAALEAAAKKATAGPWREGTRGPNGCPVIGTERGLMLFMGSHGLGHPADENAQYVCVANPAAILELISYIRNLEKKGGARE